MVYWIWLTQIEGLGPVYEKRLLEYFGTPKDIYLASEEELLNVHGIGPKVAKNISTSKSLNKAYNILEECCKKNIGIITYNSPTYLKIAKEYKEAPIVLYYRGYIRENIEGVGVVGSRRTTEYGKRVALELGEYLGENDITVISGMAKGIDAYAHTGALKGGGYTVAFLGTGVDICYPSEHKGLMDKIIDNGAVVSQYAPGTKAKTQYFPQRNGLIASWSKKIVVVEAAEKSGALITADIGRAIGREIFALPHTIYSKTGVGANNLLLRGATPLLNFSQLLTELQEQTPININDFIQPPTTIRTNKKETQVREVILDPIEQKIIDCLKVSPKTIEQISDETRVSQLELLELLPTMELENKISVLPGGRYLGN